MFFKFTTKSRKKPSVQIIPRDKILRIYQNPPIKCDYEDFNLESFNEEKDNKRYYASCNGVGRTTEITLQNLDENGNIIGGQFDWVEIKEYTPEYNDIIEWVKAKKYPEWKDRVVDTYSPFSIQLIDGQCIQILEDLDQITDILEGPVPF